MKNGIYLGAVMALVVLAAGVWLQPAQCAAQSPALKDQIGDFAWLAGSWRGEADFGIADVHYSSLDGGVMMGMFRLLSKGDTPKVLILEFLSLHEAEAGIELRLRHFNPALDIDPAEREAPIVLRYVQRDGEQFIFENPVDNRPKRSIITRVGEHGMRARSEIVNKDGKISVIEVVYERVTN